MVVGNDVGATILAQKPAHWLGYYEGSWGNAEGGPMHFVPATMTHDQLREVNAKRPS